MQRSRTRRSLDELGTISLLWKILNDSPRNQGIDLFSDDVTWVRSRDHEMVIFKSDMLVSSTDAPSQMTPSQMGSKAIVSCISDFAAKGVKPVACLISLAIPRDRSNKQFLTALAKGFRKASHQYGVKILGGDTNESKSEVIVDCSMLGFADKIIHRDGGKPGDLIGSTGYFGMQSCGLEILLDRGGRHAVPKKSFKLAAIKTVLEPRARLKMGLSISPFASSSIDSSDGLALSLYELAEASRVDFHLDYVPIAPGVEEFARKNSLSPEQLALFGGEEYELIFTFPAKDEMRVRGLGAKVLGKVTRRTFRSQSRVLVGSRVVQRRGFVHNRAR